MDFLEYTEAMKTAAALHEAGKYNEAISAFDALLSTDVSDRDKGIICHNIAVIYKEQNLSGSALSWYERGRDYERPHGGTVNVTALGSYLYDSGRFSESLTVWEDMLKWPSLTEVEKNNIRNNIALIKERL